MSILLIMKKTYTYTVALAAIFLFLFIVNGCSKKEGAKSSAMHMSSQERGISYYTCGMHPSVHVSPAEYKKGQTTCPICNMNLTPVYEEAASGSEAAGPKILFYRHPFDASMTSPIPAEDERGVAFVPVYEQTGASQTYYGCGMEGQEHVFAIQGISGMSCPVCGMPLKPLSKAEADALTGVVSRVKIGGAQIKRAGVVTEPVERHQLYKEIRTVGKVAYDPALAVAEEEFISALKALDKIAQGDIVEITERAQKLVASGRKKLLLLGLSQEQIDELQQTRTIHSNLILPSQKMWIYGEVYEYELPWVHVGSRVRVSTASLPGEEFPGVISSLNPVVDSKTRSLTFRAEIDNPDLKLKPHMYVDALISSGYVSANGEQSVLAIRKEAVLDTGMRKIVWVQQAGGEYEGREVQIGPEASSDMANSQMKFYPVLKGLNEGELIVTKANFLIDSQSQISGVAASAYGGSLEPEAGAMPAGHHH